ncbi:MAG: helix-turn-helix domain-containing protein [Burkholderiaceae bacterium]
MPDLATTLKQEISRLARKELRREVDALKKAASAYRADIAALKRTVAELHKAIKVLSRQKAGVASGAAGVKRGAADDASAGKLRFRPGGMATNRKRLGLSAADFGLLVGASSQSVYLWEQGKARPSGKSLIAISSLRGIGKREATARLAALKGPAGGKKKAG